MSEKRTTAARVAQTQQRLNNDENVWIATASLDGVPHLVPLSLAWDGEAILVATPTNTPTVRNALASGRVRAALESAADVVLLDTDVAVSPFAQADPDQAAAYVARVGWDPRNQDGEWSLLRLTPSRVQAWNSVDETDGRTLMRDGAWID